MVVSPIARGGRRKGMQGRNYSNRLDLNADRQPTGGLMLPPPPQTGGPAGQIAQPTQPTGAPPAGPPPPGGLGTFLPSQRPGEPLTHGLPSGPGGGPEVLQRPFTPDPIVQAAAAFQAVPVVHQTPLMKGLMAATSAAVQNVSNPGIAPGSGQ